MTRSLFLLAALFFAVPAAVQQPAQPDTATIYIYKGWHVNTLWRAAFAVYMNEKMIARLDRGIYLIAKLPPGRYEFRTKNRKAGGVELNVKPGETYYIRMDTESGNQVTNPRLSLAPIEQATFDLKQMKAIEPKDVKDKSVVLTTYPKR